MMTQTAVLGCCHFKTYAETQYTDTRDAQKCKCKCILGQNQKFWIFSWKI